MSAKDDMLGAIFMVACLHPFKKLEYANGFYIVTFEGTTANFLVDEQIVTKKEILATIREAKS